MFTKTFSKKVDNYHKIDEKNMIFTLNQVVNGRFTLYR